MLVDWWYRSVGSVVCSHRGVVFLFLCFFVGCNSVCIAGLYFVPSGCILCRRIVFCPVGLYFVLLGCILCSWAVFCLSVRLEDRWMDLTNGL